MRGEQASVLTLGEYFCGSSPHARGTGSAGPRGRGRSRIIPACAGNSPHPRRRPKRPADHPRMRGEQRVPGSSSRRRSGSSPHARGTGYRGRRSFGSSGIIPACAGNRARFRRRRPASADHPRMRGEQTPPARSGLSCPGSSPHARGTVPATSRRPTPSRIIPACAGNSQCGGRWARDPPDHPRMRGEQAVQTEAQLSRRGSSPHARGTDLNGGTTRARGRIIPACAGNRRTQRHTETRSADHPRMRGEQFNSSITASSYAGSSPHARGTVSTRLIGDVKTRIIPACAGNSAALMITWRADPDHPRMRGEQFPHG